MRLGEELRTHSAETAGYSEKAIRGREQAKEQEDPACLTQAGHSHVRTEDGPVNRVALPLDLR